ncbi:MAG: Aminoglycoside N(6')-acetyltransferase type 1 [Candidatus Izimaplasma bacterium HR2]|nr:MAG: Aminoglycoside N(6')-acetyltransferase type 1 [Candidatus Izimaplasma bacterium HR2]
MISFRNVVEDDFITLHNWLKVPHVKEYWYQTESFTYEEICKKYSKRLKKGIVELYIIQKNGKDIGFIQTYIIDEPTAFMVKDKIKGIDLYIGEVDYIHKGYGKDIIDNFVINYIFNDKSIRFAGIDPEVENVIAIKAYKKSGFKHVNTEYSKYNKNMTYYMILDRFDKNL